MMRHTCSCWLVVTVTSAENPLLESREEQELGNDIDRDLQEVRLCMKLFVCLSPSKVYRCTTRRQVMWPESKSVQAKHILTVRETSQVCARVHGLCAGSDV